MRKVDRVCITLIAVLAGIAIIRFGTPTISASPTPQEAARVELSSWLESLRGDENLSLYGFMDLSELDSVTLGEPYPVFLLSLEELRKYRPNVKVRDVVRDIQQFDFPLYVNGEARGFLTVEHFEGQWKVVALGGYPVSRELQAFQRQSNGNNQGQEVKLLRVPSIDGTFILVERVGAEKIARLGSYPGVMAQTERGREYHAPDVVPQIRKAVEEFIAAQERR